MVEIEIAHRISLHGGYRIGLWCVYIKYEMRLNKLWRVPKPLCRRDNKRNLIEILHPCSLSLSERGFIRLVLCFKINKLYSWIRGQKKKKIGMRILFRLDNKLNILLWHKDVTIEPCGSVLIIWKKKYFFDNSRNVLRADSDVCMDTAILLWMKIKKIWEDKNGIYVFALTWVPFISALSIA